jgi:hypothetical protein
VAPRGDLDDGRDRGMGSLLARRIPGVEHAPVTWNAKHIATTGVRAE